MLTASRHTDRSSPELADPYNNIELLPFDDHGWYYNADHIY